MTSAVHRSSTAGTAAASAAAFAQPKQQAQAMAASACRVSRRRHSYPFQRSCLRKTSAYCGGDGGRVGSRLDELSTSRRITVRFGDEPKKTLSFADQHGRDLHNMREYCPHEAPTEFCDLERDAVSEQLAHRRRSSSLDDWIVDAMARQHLVSVCVVSLLGCALIGLRQTSK